MEMTEKLKKLYNFCLLIFVGLVLVFLKLRIDAGGWTINAVKTPTMWLPLCLVLVHSLISMVLLLICALKSRIVAYVVLPYVVFILLVSLYIHFSYGYVEFSEQVVALMGTTWKELSALLTPMFYLVTVIAVALIFFGIWCMRRYVFVLKDISARCVVAVSVFYVSVSSLVVLACAEFCPGALLPVLYGVNVNDNPEPIREDMLTNIVNNTCPAYAYRVLVPFYRQLLFPCAVVDWYLPSHLEPSENMNTEDLGDVGDDLTVVLVIGESYRSSHASWNGYHRETLPKLSRHRNEIINFPYFASYATSTASSIYGLLSDATCETREASMTSFLGIFKKHGYSAYLLLCRTTHWENNPDIHAVIDNKLDGVYELADSSDIERKLESLAALPGKKIIHIEDGTGHAPYEQEAQFAKFGNLHKVDKYNNALLQTDDLLCRLLNTLKDREAVLLYASDHGQSFGEHGHYMHGGILSVVEQRHVFAFLWASETYCSKQVEMLENIRRNSSKYLTHDDIYFSILSLGGIKCQHPYAEIYNFTLPLDDRPEENEFRLKK